MKRNCTCIISTLFILTLLLSCNNHHAKLVVGGYTKNGEKGISFFDFNENNGNLKLMSQSDVGPSPAYFCFSEKRRMLFALNSVPEFNGTPGGGITTLKYNSESGLMQKMSELHLPYGGPCYISMSPDSGFLFVANYPKGSVLVVKLDANGIPETITDSLVYYKGAPIPSHAHMILNDPSGKKIYVIDLGLDKILCYDFDVKTGKLNQGENGSTLVPLGSGPRHFAFNNEGSKFYLINELGSTMMVFNVHEKAGLELIQTISTLREGFKGNNNAAEIVISKDGKFLYGSNRGENTIVTYIIGKDGLLTLSGHTTCSGDWPRYFVLSPDSRFLLVGNQKSDNISVFRIDNKSGLPVEPAKLFSSVSPACLKFMN
jgi:6-phosphogluconolactonase